jgi:uncharacterized membrane protein YccC
MMRRYINEPIFWCWIFVAIGLAHVIAALIYDRWGGLIIALVGFIAALLIATVIQRRRYKNNHPENKGNMPSG